VSRRRHNPVQSGLSSDSILFLGIGTAVVGVIVYAVATLSDKLNASTTAITQAGAAGQEVAGQIGAGAQSAQDVAAQIAAANATVQQQANSPAVTTAQQAAAWWQSW
jgi:hypothetical protein